MGLGVVAVGALGVVLATAGTARRGVVEFEWPSSLEKLQRDALNESATVLVRVHLAIKLEQGLGRLAKQRGSTPEVRRLGALMATDMSRSDDELAGHVRDEYGLDLARITRIVDHTGTLRRHVRDVRAQFAGLQGAAFDARFVDAVSRVSEEILTPLEEGWRATPQPRVRAHLDRLAAMTQQHRQIADGLRSK